MSRNTVHVLLRVSTGVAVQYGDSLQVRSSSYAHGKTLDSPGQPARRPTPPKNGGGRHSFSNSEPTTTRPMIASTATLYEAAASSVWILGAIVGVYLRPSRRFVAGALVLSSGALFTALTFDFFKEHFEIGGSLVASGCCLSAQRYSRR